MTNSVQDLSAIINRKNIIMKNIVVTFVGLLSFSCNIIGLTKTKCITCYCFLERSGNNEYFLVSKPDIDSRTRTLVATGIKEMERMHCKVFVKFENSYTIFYRENEAIKRIDFTDYDSLLKYYKSNINPESEMRLVDIERYFEEYLFDNWSCEV